MAKPRKQKNEEQKHDNSIAVVRHQKLCLSIDLDKRRIYGYTELEIAVPENGIVGLHADNLVIENVTVDGEAAKFEVYPHFLDLESDSRWSLVSSAGSAADAAGSVYLSCLDRELVPNLLIMCSKSVKPAVETSVEPKEGAEQENGTQSSSGEAKQNVKIIHIDYWVEKAETGIHIDANVLHTDNQIRRAGCWFPCIDESSQRCCFDMEFTVAHNLVAVSTGTLLCQVLSKDDPPRKTFVYKLSIPVAARWISLAVAPFEILPDRHSAVISHFCLAADLSKLRHTVGFLHNAYSHYEHYLSMKFPFGSYTQVFIAPEMAISSLSLGAAMSVFSSQILFDEKIIDQTIDTRIKLAYGLARQWFGVFITAEAPNDEWLLDGLAEFLTDSFIKQFLGNNEARYRRFKANSAVCKADDSAATALSSSEASKDLYGTQCVGFYGKIRAWKSVAILQMLEKQMGPESFCKILKNIVATRQGQTRPSRTLSTKEFRHLANEVGNLERPFLRDFFHRWVGCSGCPVLKMGFSYNKRKNMVELAVLRGCTTVSDLKAALPNGNPDSAKREGDIGWPGMMSIRVHELDGMYDHPVLPMAGDTWQLLEIQCHSKLAAKRFQKSKKGPKHDGSDDNDAFPAIDVRSNADSPLMWLRADPEMEYLAEIHFNQPVQMWINQMEKDKDVVAQAQAIPALESFPHLPSVINALSNLLSDSQAFWRVRIEAAFALANTASEENDWAGLHYLIKFYKSRRFDMNIGLPKPNDFHDFAEYFVLEAIPNAIALVRTTDKQSPREAVDFILQLLKYNDNNGNPFSDVFWLAALVQAIGELEFGIQSVSLLSSILKRIDRLLQFDRLMASYNGILTVSCIRTLTQMAINLSEYVPLDRIIELIKPFHSAKIKWQVRMEASRALLDLEFHRQGIDAALILFIRYLEEEQSLRGQVKLGIRAMRLCQLRVRSGPDHGVEGETLVALLRLLESSVAFNNVILRHYLFCILQVLAGRPPTLCGVPRDETLRVGHVESCIKNLFADLVEQSKPTESPMETFNPPYDVSVIKETIGEPFANGHEKIQPVITISDDLAILAVPRDEEKTKLHEESQPVVNPISNNSDAPEAPIGGDTLTGGQEQRNPILLEAHTGTDTVSNSHEQLKPLVPEVPTGGDTVSNSHERNKPVTPEAPTISNSHERKKPPVLKIRVKHSSASSKAEDADNATLERSQGGYNGAADHGASSSVSVEAPQRNLTETVSISNQNQEDVNSSHDVGSRVTASIGSARPASEPDELFKELQCTADSSKVPAPQLFPFDEQSNDAETIKVKYASLESLTRNAPDIASSLPMENPPSLKKEKEKKKKDKEKDKKRKRDDPEYLEKKRLKKEKKEKKRKEKEMAKLKKGGAAGPPSLDLKSKEDESEAKMPLMREETRAVPSTMEAVPPKVLSAGGSKIVIRKPADTANVNAVTEEGKSLHSKLKIKIKNRTLNKP